jgi:hypothetical protein
VAALVARAAIGDGLVAEVYEDGVLWISQTRGKQQGFELTGDAPANLLAFLSRNRELLQKPEQDLEDLQAEQE